MPNKIALITGVGPGTGSSLARCFHAEGYKIAMIARNQERLSNLEKELPGSKGFICDVRDSNSINSTIDNVIKEFGSILESCELARYTPIDIVAMQEDYDKAAKTISLIDKQAR